MDLALRPRSATEIVDAAVRLFRRHFAAFFTLALVSLVPQLALSAAQLGMLYGAGGLATAVGANPFAMMSGPYLLLALVGILVTGVFQGAFVALADDGLRTGSATAGRALSRGMARAVPVTLVFLAVTVVASLGALLLIVPGVYLGLRLYPAVPAAALEGVGAGEALARAWRRTGGSVGRGFLVYLIIVLIALLAYLAFGVVGAVLGGLVGALGGATGAVIGAGATAVITSLLTGTLMYPLLAAATTVFYYDTRVRTEALDVELMADALGGPGGAPSAGAAY